MKKLLLLLCLPLQLAAQHIPFESFKKYPFPTELVAAPSGSKIAWAMDEQGRRNVYVAEGPDYKPRKLTNYTQDDGQEITSLNISDDGQQVVFVRGGEHGSNWESGLPVNPAGDLFPFTAKIGSIPFQGGEVKYLSEGDEPVIHPNSKMIAFIKNTQVWTSSIDSIQSAKNLFAVRGTVNSLSWSPDGTELMFVSVRGDHSIIGIYSKEHSSIRWITPSFTFDSSPRWSLDGKKIVFVRTPGLGGAPDSVLIKRHRPWSIYIADIATNKETLLWKAPKTLRGSLPTTHGGTNLHWGAGDRIVFLSYHDGWPHLYSISASGGQELLLTPGNFMCEHIRISSDKTQLTFSANTGPDPLDIERRHAARVSVAKADLQVYTPGTGLEWAPVLVDNGNVVAFIHATASQPPLPAILKLGRNQPTVQRLGNELVPNDFPLDKLITPTQVVFTAPDGMSVHADLFLPPGGVVKKPAIVYVHGGPPRQMLLGWHYSDYYSNAYISNQYLASLGFVVLSVNYRLGIGYGYEFHQPARGGIFGASEYQDIKAAGEWLARQSYIDAKKIGIYGGSYGGYLTAMALAKDSRLFAAGVDIHGVHDWGVNASIIAANINKIEKAPDYDKSVQTAWRSSPIAFMDTWRSPVLVIHADDDRNVRVNQSTDLINRLAKRGVPYESMLIVDDTHHWMKWANAVKVHSAVADFFVRKLK